MKLLAVRLARSIWLIPPYFLNPKGAYIRPSIEAFKERYKFEKSPYDTPGVIPNPQDGAKFENGVFVSENGPVTISSLTIHGDGFVVDARSSTEDGNAFAEDALGWVAKEHSLPDPNKLPITKLFASELNISFDKDPKLFDPKLAPFFKDLSSAISSEESGKPNFLSFHFGTDPTIYKTQRTFRIDREVNIPHEQNRFYSFAPTRTDVHLKLLEKLDALL